MRFYFFFKGAEVSQEGKKKEDYGSGIDAEIKALAKESPPNKVDSTVAFEPRSDSHSLYISLAHLFNRVDLFGESILF